jgi:putative drug exporter of the RND superfamily
MLERLGHFLVRRRWWVLGATIAAVMVSGAVGGNVAQHLLAGGFEDDKSESSRAVTLRGEEFGQAPPNLVLLVEAASGDVNDEASSGAGISLARELSEEAGVSQVIGHWTIGPGSPLQSADGSKALIVGHIDGNEEVSGERIDELGPKYTRSDELLSVKVGGFEAVFSEVSETIESDLARGETIALPITLALLIVVFGSVVAASLPVGIGIIAILGTFFILRLLTEVTDVSIFALSMVTAMGLGLAIDYSLFVVSRFREELRGGADTETAIVTTMRTAGRTIMFSGITVAVSLSSLLVFPLVFFRSFGFAGIGVVLMAVLGAVIFLPSVLAILGPRVDRLTLWRRRPKEVGEGFWHHLALVVMRRPIPVAVGFTAFVLILYMILVRPEYIATLVTSGLLGWVMKQMPSRPSLSRPRRSISK